MKWGIQIPFEDGFMWVTNNDWTLSPLLFDSQEEAQYYVLKVWGSSCKVAEYKEHNNEP